MEDEPRKSKPGDVLLDSKRVVCDGKVYRVDYRDFLGVRGYTVFKDGHQVTNYEEFCKVLDK